MSYHVLLYLRQTRTVNIYRLQKCLSQLRPRLHHSADKNHHGNMTNLRERPTMRTKRKALQKKILQDIRQTKEKMEEIIERENIYTIPNVLSIGRIVSTPYLSYLIVSHDYKVQYYMEFIFKGLYSVTRIKKKHVNQDFRIASSSMSQSSFFEKVCCLILTSLQSKLHEYIEIFKIDKKIFLIQISLKIKGLDQFSPNFV